MMYFLVAYSVVFDICCIADQLENLYGEMIVIFSTVTSRLLAFHLRYRLMRFHSGEFYQGVELSRLYDPYCVVNVDIKENWDRLVINQNLLIG